MGHRWSLCGNCEVSLLRVDGAVTRAALEAKWLRAQPSSFAADVLF